MSKIKIIGREELKKWIDEEENFVLIDTLGPVSYAEKHLSGAVEINGHTEDFLKQAEKVVLKKDTPVVVYCASFDCNLSTACAKKLVEAGYTNVYDFKGGLQD